MTDQAHERPRLFKASVFQNDTLGRETGLHPTIPTIEKEIWRTETILNVFITMWLSIEGSDDGSYRFVRDFIL
jgi:hypothetical protein